MPRGSKAKYSAKQKRQAEHIEEGYEKRGTSKGEAERRAWATVNKMTGGGKASGSGNGRHGPVGREGGSLHDHEPDAAAVRRAGSGSRSASRPRSAESPAARAATGNRLLGRCPGPRCGQPI